MARRNSFTCISCKRNVLTKSFGTKNRNHCPYCLASVHLDEKPGDRKSKCHGVMIAQVKMYKEDGEEVLVHECIKCGMIRKNRVAGDDSTKAIAQVVEVEFF